MVNNTKKNNKRRRKGGKGRRKEYEFDRRVIDIRRVAKVRAGAKRLRFSALVVTGDRKGKVGIALGRAGDTRSAIDKAARKAEADMVSIDMIGDTIPHEIFMKYSAAKVLIKPAGPGTGIIASSAVRAVMEVVGIRNVLTKQLGSDNPISNAYCAFEALKALRKRRVLDKESKSLGKKLKINKRQKVGQKRKNLKQSRKSKSVSKKSKSVKK